MWFDTFYWIGQTINFTYEYAAFIKLAKIVSQQLKRDSAGVTIKQVFYVCIFYTLCIDFAIQ